MTVIRARAPRKLAARLARIALAKQATPQIAGVVREACVQVADREERELGLAPITDAEVERLTGKAA